MTDTNPNQTILVGFDNGMGGNKTYGPNGGGIQIAQVAADNGQAVSDYASIRKQRPPQRIGVDRRCYYAGANSHSWGHAIENLGYDRLDGVIETRVLLYASLTEVLHKLGLDQATLSLVVGLPLEPLAGPQAQANVESIRRWMVTQHHWEADGRPYQARIAEVKIASQPLGAVMDYLLDDAGAFIQERKTHITQELGVISVGFNTVEIMVMRERAPVQAMTGGKTIGVRRLLELVEGSHLYTLGELDSMLRSGALNTADALPVWVREVSGQIEKLWGTRWQRFSRVIVVGGGALLLKRQLQEKFGNWLYLPDDPVMSIARGLYKLGLMQQNGKKARG